jgi:hypothetical protein
VSRLSIELVPSTAWWSNVRSNVSRADWEKCKRFVRARSGDRCEVCGGRGRRWPVECHEIWHYDDENEIQTLVGLIALCPSCHEVKHIGRAMAMGNLERAIDHLCRVNGWQPEHAGTYIEVQLEIHALRSTHQWKLDISFLETLGINATVTDRIQPHV